VELHLVFIVSGRLEKIVVLVGEVYLFDWDFSIFKNSCNTKFVSIFSG
jgi:hypothetical protein